MKKSILNLKGSQELNATEQKQIQGGALRYCCETAEVNGREVCVVWSRYGVCP